MPKKGEYVQFKNFERKTKLPFMIYVDFESILVPEGNGKKSLNGSYTINYQKHVACSYGYRLVCFDCKFRKPFKSSLGKYAVLNFISSMIEEIKYCSDVMKKHFKKELVMNNEDNEDFKSSAKCWISNFHITIILMMMLQQEIIVISLENIEVLRIGTAISVLNQITNFPSYVTS